MKFVFFFNCSNREKLVKTSDEFVFELWFKECLKSSKNATKNPCPIIGGAPITGCTKYYKLETKIWAFCGPKDRA